MLDLLTVVTEYYISDEASSTNDPGDTERAILLFVISDQFKLNSKVYRLLKSSFTSEDPMTKLKLPCSP